MRAHSIFTNDLELSRSGANKRVKLAPMLDLYQSTYLFLDLLLYRMESEMSNNLRATIIVLMVSAAFPAMAQGIAQGDKCPTVPRDQWMSVEALKTKVEALGYMVRRVKIDDGCHKVYITDKASGGEVEAYYNPATGELVQAKLSR
jgi:hypothetical protein